MTNEELEKHWNEKHPKQNVIYSGRNMSKICPTCRQTTLSNQLKLDVRTLVSNDDILLKELIQKHNLKGSSHDDTMMRIQKYVCANLKYTYDEHNQGALEFWQFPFETISSWVGDCEDGAILIVALGLNAGVPSFRLRVVAGMVQQAPTAPEGGHGYCTYLRESDNNWVILDWCFFQNPSVEIKDKPMIKDHKEYKEAWFSFNDKFSWGNKTFEVTERLFKKGE